MVLRTMIFQVRVFYKIDFLDDAKKPTIHIFCFGFFAVLQFLCFFLGCFSIPLEFLCSFLAKTLQCMCGYSRVSFWLFPFFLQSLCNFFAVSLRSLRFLCGFFAVSLWFLCGFFAVSLQFLC